ncbi:heterokaryon incompatibility Het-C [Hortaea werneckii]|nr:heterokaryon incompatibility Het-C [Hortaea werneckii]KAI7062528.1 heterokaryon incompatibility Het-C [Hortaea werneckii]KAI7210699.1 heterokaryon incompatibility Het-C [Hortaea werneckii]KAI7287341.1 heterokaryon incompatibility Het-C [Hortaea werneckii]KAI7378742.1 heterokaryon incompatibility Het-C [Hortaea werneckii]
MARNFTFLLLVLVALAFLASPTAAFGAGNISSLSKIEGHNWRHGDLEDLLKTVAFIRGQKWTSMMVKRAYFGNWLRDYSQAVDVGTLKGVQADTIRVLLWVLAFMSFGYATLEFEVTAERLGCYRPEEHIDNPKDYADNEDARKYDPRLRGPVMPAELEVDPATGMKNYIANERGGWATSLGYIKYSFARSIHFGRMYTHGPQKGRDEDLCEALRCLGQGLHCLEDFGAHTNYTELALRELGFNNVFPHVGTQTMINLRGKQVFPLVTGTFGGVDFLHSVLGEATDHVTQSEVNETEVAQLDAALSQAQDSNHGKRGGGNDSSSFIDLLGQVPGTGGLVQEALDLQAQSEAQAAQNQSYSASRDAGAGGYMPYGDQYGGARASNPSTFGQQGQGNFQAPPGSQGGPPGPGIPGVNVNVDPQQVVAKIYPLLAFRDRVVRSIAGFVEKIPGLEKMIETISEKVTLFVMGLLAPYIKPLIAAASNALKQGSGTVQRPHPLLAQQRPLQQRPQRTRRPNRSSHLTILRPRVIYGWDHPEVPENEILDDIGRTFHHPALRDPHCELHRNMFRVVEQWVQTQPDRGAKLNHLLSSESVKAGHNHKVQDFQHSLQPLQNEMQHLGTASHSHTAGGPMAMFAQQRSLDADPSGQAYAGGYPGGAAPHDYAHASYSHAPPAPAGFAPEGGSAFPTAYQQGYEAPYSQAPPPPPAGYQQSYQGAYDQSGGYGMYGDPSQGYGHQGGGYGRY